VIVIVTEIYYTHFLTYSLLATTTSLAKNSNGGILENYKMIYM